MLEKEMKMDMVSTTPQDPAHGTPSSFFTLTSLLYTAPKTQGTPLETSIVPSLSLGSLHVLLQPAGHTSLSIAPS